jgi:hypothetical protein
MKKSDLERRTDASTCKMMAPGFVPGPYEILIGRGRRCTMHWGNQRLRHMIATELEGYAAANCKRHKSSIIGRVLADIKKHSPHAGFIKNDVATGRWLSFTDAASRVAIAQAFRDALDDSYKSSKHSKQAKRKMYKSPALPFTDLASFAQMKPIPLLIKLDDVEKDDDTKMMDASIDDATSIEAFPEFGRQNNLLPGNMEYLPLDDASMSQVMIGSDEFDALFCAFARDGTDMEDSPYEPLPLALAESSVSSICVGELVATPPVSPIPATKQSRYFKISMPNGPVAPFGNTPFRNVRTAVTA